MKNITKNIIIPNFIKFIDECKASNGKYLSTDYNFEDIRNLSLELVNNKSFFMFKFKIRFNQYETLYIEEFYDDALIFKISKLEEHINFLSTKTIKRPSFIAFWRLIECFMKYKYEIL